MHMPLLSSDQIAYPSDYSFYSNYWNNELPYQQSNDAFSDETASYLTVIKPKTSPNPYASTLYNKDVRNSIYHLAANVNSLESSEKKKPWVHSLLQTEINYQPQSTTPQVILAYSPHIFEAHSAQFGNIKTSTEQSSVTVESKLNLPSTTKSPVAQATDEPFSMYKHVQLTLPTRPPMYLIIQGHSKVKTYGADYVEKDKKHEPKMVPVAPNKDPVVKHVVSEDRNGNEIQVKHLHKLHSTNSEIKAKSDKQQNEKTKKVTNLPMVQSLLSFLDTSFGNLSVDDNATKTKAKLKSSSDKNLLSNKVINTIAGPTTVPTPLNSATANVNR